MNPAQMSHIHNFLGIGSLNAVAFETFLEDLNQRGILRDAMEKKVRF